MAFEKIFEDINFNFQANRILSFGDAACNREEIYKIATKINDFDTWYLEWRNIAEVAEREGRYMHSMYYYRMAEFMLTDDNPNKDTMYYKCVEAS